MERINPAFEIYHFDDFADNDKDNVDKDQDEIINSDLVTQLGTDGGTKLDEFSEKFQGGSFSIQKFILQILGTLNRAFHSNTNTYKNCKCQCICQILNYLLNFSMMT